MMKRQSRTGHPDHPVREAGVSRRTGLLRNGQTIRTVNSETGTDCREARVFRIIFFIKIVWCRKIFQENFYLKKLKKNVLLFFSFELFFNTQGQKIRKLKKNFNWNFFSKKSDTISQRYYFLSGKTAR